jgi:hypothetical protein
VGRDMNKRARKGEKMDDILDLIARLGLLLVTLLHVRPDPKFTMDLQAKSMHRTNAQMDLASAAPIGLTIAFEVFIFLHVLSSNWTILVSARNSNEPNKVGVPTLLISLV